MPDNRPEAIPAGSDPGRMYIPAQSQTRHLHFRDLFEQIGWEYYRSENFNIMHTSNTNNEEVLTSESVHTNV